MFVIVVGQASSMQNAEKVSDGMDYYTPIGVRVRTWRQLSVLIQLPRLMIIHSATYLYHVIRAVL